MGSAFLSQASVRRFLGYLDSQLASMLGRRRGAPARPRLVAEHGYDTRYASHALRLAHQGLEVLRDGRLTLPMPEPARERVRRIKRGEVPSQAEVVDEIDGIRDEIEARLAAGDTPLPESPDVPRISAWSVQAHRRHWRW